MKPFNRDAYYANEQQYYKKNTTEKERAYREGRDDFNRFFEYCVQIGGSDPKGGSFEYTKKGVEKIGEDTVKEGTEVRYKVSSYITTSNSAALEIKSFYTNDRGQEKETDYTLYRNPYENNYSLDAWGGGISEHLKNLSPRELREALNKFQTRKNEYEDLIQLERIKSNQRANSIASKQQEKKDAIVLAKIEGEIKG